MKNSNFKWVKSLFVLGVVYALSGLNLNAQTTDSIKKIEKEKK